MKLVILILEAIVLDEHVIVHLSLLDVELLVFFEAKQLLLHLFHEVNAFAHLLVLISVNLIEFLL